MTTTDPTPRLLRLPEVEQLTGLRRSAIYAAARRGHFPKPRKLTAVASAWLEPEIRQWIESRPLADDSPPTSVQR
jgi:prophage regulatory protein